MTKPAFEHPRAYLHDWKKFKRHWSWVILFSAAFILLTMWLVLPASSAPWIRSMERELGRVTGPRSCGVFLNKHVPGRWSPKAIANRSLGRPSACKPGAVAVMNGHVGVIHYAGCRGGRCSVISGNGRGGRVDIKSYPRSRIVACRWPRYR